MERGVLFLAMFFITAVTAAQTRHGPEKTDGLLNWQVTSSFTDGNSFRTRSAGTTIIGYLSAASLSPPIPASNNSIQADTDCSPAGSRYNLLINDPLANCLESVKTPVKDEKEQRQGLPQSTDVRWFGVRTVFINAIPKASSAICTRGSNQLQVASINQPFLNGDGITVPGCGPATRMSTPAITSVTPVHPADALNTGHVVSDTSGNTTYCFKIAARDTAWGISKASQQVCTTQGPSSLGQQSVPLSGCFRTLGTTTCATTRPLGFTTGTRVYIDGTNYDAFFAGFPAGVTVVDSTHFSFSNGIDARNGGPASSLNGTVRWENGIQVAMSPTATGVYNYVVYETSPAPQLLGPTLPTGLENGYSDPSYLTFTYWGSTISTPFILPYWVPSTPPASAINDNLTTTIVSGAKGTDNTILTLAASAGASSSSTAIFDNTPNILSAKNYVNTHGGFLYFPPSNESALSYTGTYVTESYLNLGRTDLAFAEPIYLGDTLETAGKIRGDLFLNSKRCSQPQFALSCQPSINTGTAYPGIWTISGQMRGATISGNGNNYLAVLDTNPGSAYYADINFVGGADYDYTGILYLNWGSSGGPFGGRYDRISMLTGPNPQVNGNSTGLAMWFRNQEELQFHYWSMARRGIGIQVADFGLGGTFDQGQETQGPIMPSIVFLRNRVGTPSVQFNVKNFTLDTSGSAMAANWSAVGNANVFLNVENVNAPGSGEALFTGRGFASVNLVGFSSSNSALGQNTNISVKNGAGVLAIDGAFSSDGTAASFAPDYFMAPMILSPSNSLFTDILPPPAPSCTVVAGGTVSVGSHTLTIHAVFYNGTKTGGEGRSSYPCTFTTTTGNQSVKIGAVSVSGAIGYDIYLDGYLSNAGGTCKPPQVTSLPYTLTGGGCGNSEPGGSGTGPAGIRGKYIWGQTLATARSNQVTANEYAGTCVFSSSATCSVRYSTAYASIPVVILTPVNPGPITFTLTSTSNTGFTITASDPNSLTVNWMAIGNPN